MDVKHTRVDKPWNELYKELTLGSKLEVKLENEDEEVRLLPSSFLTRLRLTMSGSYVTIRNLRIRVVPLVSRNSGISGRLYLRDMSDTTERPLHLTDRLDLGQEIRLCLKQIDFSMPVDADIPIVFGIKELLTPHLEGRALFHLSLVWRFGISRRCYTLKPAIWEVQYQKELETAKTASPPAKPARRRERARKKTDTPVASLRSWLMG